MHHIFPRCKRVYSFLVATPIGKMTFFLSHSIGRRPAPRGAEGRPAPGVGQARGEVVQGGEQAAVARMEDRVVLGVRVGGSQQDVNDEGVDEAAEGQPPGR